MYILSRSDVGKQPGGPLVLLILDGVGEGDHGPYDCVFRASTPNLDWLRANGYSTVIAASGPAVGLTSESDMGNSEVGHNTMGAGRIFDQGANVIDQAFDSEDVWGRTWQDIVARTQGGLTTLHLVGLLSHGRVHSDSLHLYKILERSVLERTLKIRIHVLLDGRDVEDFTALEDVNELESLLTDYRERGFDYRIASGGGRMVTTMDRYGSNWGVVKSGWDAHVLGMAKGFMSATEAINSARSEFEGLSDQLIPAFTVVDSSGTPVGQIGDGDVVLVFNFRGDRAIEICEALSDKAFDHFDRVRTPDVLLASMTQYERDSGFPDKYLVEPPRFEDTVSELLAAAKVAQFACAETQKFGHVTYFWNGNRSEPFDPSIEKYVEIPSDVVPFDERPWMKSAQTADAIIHELNHGTATFVRANFAGGDMVGHTANLDATVIAVESIDLAIGRLMKIVEEAHGCLLVTADHGNAEDKVEMMNGIIKMDAGGQPILKTAHSLNKVPFVLFDYANRPINLREDIVSPGLANVASTIIELLGFESPTVFEPSLIAIDGGPR